MIELHHQGKVFEFGPIPNPAGLIETLRRGDRSEGDIAISRPTSHAATSL
ncbi:MAG: hypothetical protein JSW27_02530 [Phycisphaerales bacterium]|nr:MAG: hypothetical protein JSW27_02530 [Phycisphaerales bacterium]